MAKITNKEQFLNPLTITKEEEQKEFLKKIEPKSSNEENIR